MKKISLFLRIFSIASLLMLSGCCRKYIHWLEDRFAKADTVCMSLHDIHELAVRMEHIRHDGLMTDDTVRVMWRSNAVVEFHERMGHECAGERDDMIQKRIDELTQENKDKAIFFVSLYGTKHDWSFTICKDGYTYKASDVKTIDLDRMYRHMFGTAAFRYRQNIYQVTFDVALEQPFEFQLCNGQYRARLAW